MTIVRINDAPEMIDLERGLNEVSPQRRASALRFRFVRDQQLSIAAYLLLKDALRAAYGISENPRFAYGPHGKPYLPDHPGVYFNLSHCAKAACCIVADHPVGIDVEAIAPIDWDVARHVLSAEELANVRASDKPEVAFACYWTQKEALAKRTGEGFSSLIPHSSFLIHRSSFLIHRSSFETTVNPVRGYVLTTA